jgi:hypothetical protein
MNEDVHNGPLVGYTNKEMAEVIGQAVLDCLKREGMQITWLPPNWD